VESEITVQPLNEHYSVHIRQISESEFRARKRASEHLWHQNNYEVITDSNEARELLGNRIRGVGEFEEFSYPAFEITYDDGTTQQHNIRWYNWQEYYFCNFWAYYPEIGILIILINDDVGGNYIIDLTNSGRSVGNPSLHNLSPDKQWRLNGIVANAEGDIFSFLEKWCPKSERFEFVGDIPKMLELRATFNIFWVSNSKFIFSNYVGDGSFFEMEIIGK